jgi:hypothetical protein
MSVCGYASGKAGVKFFEKFAAIESETISRIALSLDFIREANPGAARLWKSQMKAHR